MNSALLVQAAQQEVLQNLLQFEGAGATTIAGALNDIIAKKAKELGIDLDWTQTGRGIYGGKV